MNTIKITTTQNIELEYDLASLGERIVGYLIDGLIITAYFFLLFIFVVSAGGSSFFDENIWLYVVLYLPVVFYDLISEILMNGQSIGKRVMKIKVISIEGLQPTLGQFLIRWVFRLVDFTLTSDICGMISVAVSERKQRVGDMVAGTAVIKTEPRTTFQQTIYSPTQQVNYIVTFPQVTNLSDGDMQLIKEVIIMSQNSGNILIPHKAADKIKQTLQIETSLEPLTFLRVLLSDYNYLTSRND